MRSAISKQKRKKQRNRVKPFPINTPQRARDFAHFRMEGCGTQDALRLTAGVELERLCQRLQFPSRHYSVYAVNDLLLGVAFSTRISKSGFCLSDKKFLQRRNGDFNWRGIEARMIQTLGEMNDA